MRDAKTRFVTRTQVRFLSSNSEHIGGTCLRWIATGKVVWRRTDKRTSEVLEPCSPLSELEAGAGIDYPALTAHITTDASPHF